MWTIPVHKKSKPKKQGAKTKSSAASPSKQQQRPLKEWDTTLQDHNRYKLSPLEQEWRRAQRVSKHNTRVHCQPPYSRQADVSFPAGSDYEDILQAEELALNYKHRSGGLRLYPQDAPEYDSEGSSTEAPSLSDMRDFIDSMQHKYQITPPKQPSAAQQKLAQLRREAAAARQSANDSGRRGNCSCSDGEVPDDVGSEVEAFVADAYQQHPAAGDSAAWVGGEEGDGTRGDADILRCDPEEAGQFAPSAPPALGNAADMAALRERLAAAEARLESFETTQGELVQVKQQLEELKEQHASLRSDVDDYVSHTSTLLTSLQTTMANFLQGHASRAPTPASVTAHETCSMAEEFPTSCIRKGVPGVPPVTAAFRAFQLGQEQGAARQAAAAGIATQAAHSQTALGKTAPQSRSSLTSAQKEGNADSPVDAFSEEDFHLANDVEPDVLNQVQLPSFSERFGLLSRPGSSQPVFSSFGPVKLPEATDVAAAGHSDGADPETEEPMPRSLPAVVQGSLGLVSKHGTAPAGSSSFDVSEPADFSWRPCSAIPC